MRNSSVTSFQKQIKKMCEFEDKNDRLEAEPNKSVDKCKDEHINFTR
jgi:hypothetical protein